MPPWPTDASLAGSTTDVLRLTVPGTLAAIETTRLAVLAFVARHALAPAVVYRLELVLEEALMNRCMHAYDDGLEHPTDVTVAVEPDVVVVSFADDGVPFDPTRADEPLPPPPEGEPAIGGRGLLLTRKAASAIAYRHDGGRNHVTVRLARD